MPLKFICFDCRVRADVTWELIRHDLYPRILSKFKELALFRYVMYRRSLKSHILTFQQESDKNR